MMTGIENSWKRLRLQHAGAMETLASLEEAVRRKGAREDLERLGQARALAEQITRTISALASGEGGDWKAWVSAETASLELRFEMGGLLAAPGTLREAFLTSVRDRIRRLEGEISGLLARSNRFRPRTRVAISEDARRLRRRLEALREEARRVEEAGPGAGETAIRAMGDAWSAVEWGMEETKTRFARPRWRHGRESAAEVSPL
jgi:hypothetical protein